MQKLETESRWQEYVALMTERPELFREEGMAANRNGSGNNPTV